MRYFLSFLIVIGLSSCKEEPNKNLDSKSTFEPNVDVNELTADYNKWYSYYHSDISLSADFMPLDEKSKVITKAKFLNELTSGKYIPIKLKPEHSKSYKLYTLPSDADNAISNKIKIAATDAYNFYNMEGMKFPDFEFYDINGTHYNTDSLIGKTTVLKTWFIACKPCVAEMPELNELVQSYRSKRNIQFISLSLDKKVSLLKFLDKHAFKYQVVAEQLNLIQNELNLSAYPTHLIIDRNGTIEKAFNNVSELITYLENSNP